MAWVLDSGKFQHRVHDLHTLGAEDKQVFEHGGSLFLSSTNTTLVNEKLTPAGAATELYHGDVIQIGRRKIWVLQSRIFFSGPLMLLISGAAALALLILIASAKEFSAELISVLFSSVLVTQALILLSSRKRFWSFRATSFNLILALFLSAAISEGMLRFADAQLHVSHARVPASLIDSP